MINHCIFTIASILLSFKVKVQENVSEIFYVNKQNNALFYREEDLA